MNKPNCTQQRLRRVRALLEHKYLGMASWLPSSAGVAPSFCSTRRPRSSAILPTPVLHLFLTCETLQLLAGVLNISAWEHDTGIISGKLVPVSVNPTVHVDISLIVDL